MADSELEELRAKSMIYRIYNKPRAEVRISMCNFAEGLQMDLGTPRRSQRYSEPRHHKSMPTCSCALAFGNLESHVSSQYWGSIRS
jgi:hypothetical protein